MSKIYYFKYKECTKNKFPNMLHISDGRITLSALYTVFNIKKDSIEKQNNKLLLIIIDEIPILAKLLIYALLI